MSTELITVSSFPAMRVTTPLGDLVIWANSPDALVIGSLDRIGEDVPLTVNKVDYKLLAHLKRIETAEPDFKRRVLAEGGGFGVDYQMVSMSRVDPWRGDGSYKPDPSHAAYEKVRDTLLSWLDGFLSSDDGLALMAAAREYKVQRDIDVARAAVEKAEVTLAEARSALADAMAVREAIPAG